MADTDLGATPSPETASQAELKNGTGSQATDNNVEVERLRKQAEQAQMRVNQLEKEKADRLKKEQDEERKALEEKEKYKELALSERQERERLEREREAERQASQLKATTDQVFKEYSKDVVELAEQMGLSLGDDTEDGRKSLKDKLDKLAAKVHPTTPSGNNGYTPPPPTDDDLAKKAYDMRSDTKEAKKVYFSNLKSLKKMKQQAGLQVD